MAVVGQNRAPLVGLEEEEDKLAAGIMREGNELVKNLQALLSTPTIYFPFSRYVLHRLHKRS